MGTRKPGLRQELEAFARQGGADLVGTADLPLVADSLPAQVAGLATRYPRALSLGMRLSDVIVDQHDPNEPRQATFACHRKTVRLSWPGETRLPVLSRCLAGR